MSESPKFERGSPEAPRLRYLTILFSDLSRSTPIARRLKEDYSDLIRNLQSVYRQVIARHEGTIAQISGDGVFAFFGYPETREGDGRRAVEAALDLHETARKLSGRPEWGEVEVLLHSGIHGGLVPLDEGDSVRGAFELLDCATNVASKLCGRAEPGEILVSQATLGPERHLFLTSERQFELEGVEVATLAIEGQAAARSRFEASVRGGLTPFIGRKAELERLEAAIAEAAEGDRSFLAIEGPPGVGKTRLAHELLHRTEERGLQVHRGECEAEAEPLQPFLQIARSILGLQRPVPKGQARKLLDKGLADIDASLSEHQPTLIRLMSLGRSGTAPDHGRGYGAERARAALCALFSRLAARGPAILFVDDWHLADDASREMAVALRGLDGLLLLVTTRPDGAAPAPGGSEVLPLSPFNARESAEAVARLLPSPDPFLVEGICASSGGNPLFLEELCHSVSSGERYEGPHGGSPWLDTLIESRFSRLPELQANLVRVAAVIGTIIPSWLLEFITRCGEKDLLAGLSGEDFIFPGEREGILRFKHGITRDVIYDSIARDARQALHLQIADTLRDKGPDYGEDQPYEALAYHYSAGGQQKETAEYAERAGDKAAEVSALDRAQAYYKMALAALERLPKSEENGRRWSEIAQRFGQVGVFDPSRDQLEVFDKALAGAKDDPNGRARADYWLGYIYYGLGEPVSAIRHWESAVESAAAIGDERLAIQIRAALGQAHAAACDYEKAIPLLDEAIEIKRRYRSGARPPIGFAYSLSCRGFALGDMGRFDEAYRDFEEAEAALEGVRHEVEESVLNQHSAVCLWQGRFEEGVALAEAAARIAERVRSHYTHAMSRSLAAYARWSMERDPGAIETIVEATAWLDKSGRGQFTSLNHGWLAEMMVETGRIAEGRRHAARALMRARKHDRLGEAMALRAMARASAAEGWRMPPDHYLEDANRSAQLRRSAHEAALNLLCRSELALAAGDQTAGQADLSEARRQLNHLGMKRSLSPSSEVHRVHGR